MQMNVQQHLQHLTFDALVGAALLRYATDALLGPAAVSWFSTALFVPATGLRPITHLVERLGQADINAARHRCARRPRSRRAPYAHCPKLVHPLTLPHAQATVLRLNIEVVYFSPPGRPPVLPAERACLSSHCWVVEHSPSSEAPQRVHRRGRSIIGW